MLNFIHYGKCGDIIYSLYIIKQLGGGNLYIVPNDKLRKDSFTKLEPLVLSQPYISSFIFTKNIPTDHINLNRFREISRKTLEKQHLIQTHIDAVNQFYNYKLDKYDQNTHSTWLHVPKTNWKHDYIVVQRSERYHNGSFIYKDHIEPNLRIVFCGGSVEYDKFKKLLPDNIIEYYLPKDFLEFAKLIRDSRYYIGNQSVGSAIAQGLSHLQFQETHNKEYNCIPVNSLIYGLSNGITNS